MSGRLCCYKQQQHSKLLTVIVCVQSVRLLLLHRHKDACATAWLPYQIRADPVRPKLSGHANAVHPVNVLDPPFSDIACSIIKWLVLGIFMMISNKVLPFGTRGPVIMPHRVYSICLWICGCLY